MNRSCHDLGTRRMGIKDVEAVQEASLVPAICSKMLFFFFVAKTTKYGMFLEYEWKNN